MFIAFDGIDAAGKSTQAQRLYNTLIKIGKIVQLYNMGEEGFIDEFFQQIKTKRMICNAEIRELMYYFEGTLFAKEIVEPLLKEPEKFGIVDRYLLSFFSYGPLNGISLKKIEELTKHIPWPDFYFFVDLKPETAIARISRYRKIDLPEVGYKNYLSENEEENQKKFMEHQKKVYDNYLYAISRLKERGKEIIILDGNKSENELAQIIYDSVMKKSKLYRNNRIKYKEQ